MFPDMYSIKFYAAYDCISSSNDRLHETKTVTSQ